MPKLVDHDQRKITIAEAMWRVILARGMEGATLRNIAKEAGMSLGALRYYFQNQEDLLVYAMDRVIEKASERIEAVLKTDLLPKERVIRVLLEMVPIRDDSRVEMAVWFSFKAHVHHLRPEFSVPDDRIREGIGMLLQFLLQTGILRTGLDLSLETELLYALVDGLAVHGLLDSQRLDGERIDRVLRHHLDSLCLNETSH